MTRLTDSLLATALALLLAACTANTRPPASADGYKKSPPGLPTRDTRSEFAAALTQMHQGNIDQASDMFTALTREHPLYSGPWTNLGIIHARAGQQDQAREDFRGALRANSRNVVAMNWLGYLCAEQGNFEQARKWYERALVIRPDYATARLNLAVTYDTGLRRPQQALDHYRRYREHNQSDNAIVDAWIRELETDIQATTVTDAGIRP